MTISAEADTAIQQAIQRLCATLPVSGLAIIFARVEEADDCPMVVAGTQHGPLLAVDDLTIRRLLIATTHFQQQLVELLAQHSRKEISVVGLEIERQHQLLAYLKTEIDEKKRLYNDQTAELDRLQEQLTSLRTDVSNCLRPAPEDGSAR